MAVVPADEIGRAVGALELDARNVQGRVTNRAGRKDDRVVVLLEVVERHIATEEHVAEDADAAAVEHIPKRGDDAFDARVVWRNSVAYESVWRGQLFEQVN